MADETSFGYPYPEDSDPIASYPALALELANAIQEYLGVIASGSVTVTVPTPNVVATVAVTLPAGLFPGTPRVVVSASSNTPALVGVSTSGSGSATSFIVAVQRTTATPTSVRWIAHYSA